MCLSILSESSLLRSEIDRRIWKHGVAVTVESKLDDRNVLGKQLFEVSGDKQLSLEQELMTSSETRQRRYMMK
jgi:hypothetical protein